LENESKQLEIRIFVSWDLKNVGVVLINVLLKSRK